MRLTLEQWVDHLFRHGVGGPVWYWDNTDSPVLPAMDLAVLVESVFSHAGTLLTGFSDDQVAQGLRYLISPACSDCMFLLRDGDVSAEQRRNTVLSIADLYAQCFQPRCETGMYCLGETRSPLNELCYDWWDVIPFPCIGHAQEDALLGATLEVLGTTLRLGNSACVESALRGLGIVGWKRPDLTRPVVARFAKESCGVRHELRQYALDVLAGFPT